MNDYLKPAVKQALLDAGFPVEMVEYLQRLNGVCERSLNVSSNPVKAARSIMIREKHVKWYKAFAAAKIKEESDQAAFEELLNYTDKVRENGGSDE
jgi:hypothetical protein